ncbi:hypothetical protein M0813_08788 [Anaeramoeba flamelloides]|uniref:Uncharacterized protein n=1 Tax=Anaeramoeba flamelloides TaxID=1746091 RepID=A0AAV7YTQ0_9EUKA|nr:hypothetical protein M0812_22130 [Anaeramoeba flamelloides]KAJ6228438.1 hypothetical protein M0813_08788 [Anaeramoeba flamelloides]
MGLFSSCFKKKTNNTELEHTQLQNIDVECKDLIQTNENSDLGSDDQIGGPIGAGGKTKYGEEVFDSSPESDIISYSDDPNNEKDPFTENENSSDSVLPRESDENEEKDGYSNESEVEDI